MSRYREFDVIEDIYGDETPKNQITASRPNLINSHVPEDMNPYIDKHIHQNMMISKNQIPTDSINKNFIPPMDQSGSGAMYNYNNNQQQPPPQNFMPSPLLFDNLFCRDIVNHTEHCQICTHYFFGKDKIYIGIIVALIIIIIFLLRSNNSI